LTAGAAGATERNRRPDDHGGGCPSRATGCASKRVLVIGRTGGLGRVVAQQTLALGAGVTVVGRMFPGPRFRAPHLLQQSVGGQPLCRGQQGAAVSRTTPAAGPSRSGRNCSAATQSNVRSPVTVRARTPAAGWASSGHSSPVSARFPHSASPLTAPGGNSGSSGAVHCSRHRAAGLPPCCRTTYRAQARGMRTVRPSRWPAVRGR
jgi:hypothetical protein